MPAWNEASWHRTTATNAGGFSEIVAGGHHYSYPHRSPASPGPPARGPHVTSVRTLGVSITHPHFGTIEVMQRWSQDDVAGAGAQHERFVGRLSNGMMIPLSGGPAAPARGAPLNKAAHSTLPFALPAGAAPYVDKGIALGHENVPDTGYL